MKIFNLSEVDDSGGSRNPDNYRYFINGKRVTRAEFDAIKRNAVTIDGINTYSVNGKRTFDSVAHLAK